MVTGYDIIHRRRQKCAGNVDAPTGIEREANLLSLHAYAQNNAKLEYRPTICRRKNSKFSREEA